MDCGFLFYEKLCFFGFDSHLIPQVFIELIYLQTYS